MSHLIKLNKAQREAVEHKGGPLLVLAGAGAGKTRTITYRIVHMIKSGVAPETILAVTFTNKAAKEMRERVRTLMEGDAEINRPISALTGDLPFVSTFHALCVRILREFYREIGIRKSFTIFNRSDSIQAIKRAMKQIGVDPKQYEPRSMLTAISRQKGNAITRTEFSDGAHTNPYEATVSRVWKKYETITKNENALDFDDLLLHVFVFLSKNKQVRALLQERWQYILIDEYQDTNKVQFEIIKSLIGSKNNICAVADGDQLIYGWRGAEIGNLMQFESIFSKTKLVKLEENYRSTQTILAAANDIIVKNVNRHDKKLFTSNAKGDKITIYGAMDAGDEARFVLQEAQKLKENGMPLKEIAVLYRANFQSRTLEESFLYAGIPYQVLGTRFFDRKEIKDVLSYIRAALNPTSVGDIARIVSTPPRGIGKKTLAHMLDGQEHKLTPATQKKVSEFKVLLVDIKNAVENFKASEVLKFVIKASGLESKLKHGTEDDRERFENLAELVTLASKYDAFAPSEGIEKLMEDASLATDQDELEEKTNSIKLMTVHAAKGLEFDCVFIVGLEEGLFPHTRLDEDADEEEERRLFYVALTRARKKVFLSHTFMRTLYGKQQINIPSEFLGDISDEHVEIVGETKPSHRRSVSLLDDIDF